MNRSKLFGCAILAWATTCLSQGIEFVSFNRENIYEYEGSVSVIAQAPWEQINLKPPHPSGWKIRGKVKLQRNNEHTLAASLAVEKITVDKQNGNAAIFYQNKEMQTLYNPFKIVYINDTIDFIQFKVNDSLWSRNFKRAIASAFQLKNLKNGAFVEEEPGIHGTCSVEYYITKKSNGHLSIRKIPVLYTCTTHSCGIHSHRSNVPETKCYGDGGESEKNVIVGNEAMYDLAPRDVKLSNGSNDFENFYLHRVYVEANTMLQTFESTGETQLVVSKLMLTFSESNEIVNAIDVHENMAAEKSNLIIEEHSISDVTGERQVLESSELIRVAIDLLGSLADSLEDGHIQFDQPYEHRVVDVIRIFSRCDFQSLKSLYQSINVGTSYRKETMRNLFYDIIPRTGTKASTLLTRDLITENLCKSTTAVQLLITLPFHITEMSSDLVSDCEPLMWLSVERPDIQQLGVLSFATIVHNAFHADQLSESSFDKYVKTYFNQFLDSHDYEHKLLYLQGLGNLKLGKVTDYLDPIIRDEFQSDDVRFMATWIKESVAEQSTSSERRKNYETFWPIFENRTAPIELRVAAFMTLLTSNPTSARLMSIHTLMASETNPHLVNFYRTTLLSLAGTTMPCFQKLRRLASSMIRHLPKAPAKRYWVTGNYIFDYRSSEYGLGASFQTLLIGNGKTHLPQIAFFKLRQEAMGKYTNELTLYIKARGLDHLQFGKIIETQNGATINLNKLRQILSSLKMPTVIKSPVHLEIIVQIEGKTILFFFLNQQSFDAITEGDMLNRVMKLLHMDSHINLQSLRWPFYSRYSVPTVLGTPTSLTIQSTVLCSLRGNITQNIQGLEILRSHEIDLRYTSFTVVSSKSYNPFLNMEHSINREQGFLIYLPINNDVKLNLQKSSLWFSFYRPSNLISGISLKSRIRTITRGRPLRKVEAPFVDIAIHEGDPNVLVSKLINYEIEDLGLMITGLSHPFDIMAHMKLMFHMEPSINTFVHHEMEPLMKIWSLIRVNDIHIGTNKKFTLLFHNTKNTKLEGRIAIVTENSVGALSVSQTNTIEMTFEHKFDENVLHKLSVVFIMQNNKAVSHQKKSDQLKFQLALIHTNKEQKMWMLTAVATYEPIVFLKQPYSLHGSLSFGDKNETTTTLLENPTKITFEIFADILPNTKSAYDKITDVENCPREVLHFSPPPQNKLCDQNIYRDLITIREFGFNVSFHNNADWLDHFLTRLDYFATSLSTHIDLYNFTNNIDGHINTFSDKLQLTATLNGKNVTMPNIPLWINRNIDAKFDRPEQLAFSLGHAQMCSLVSSTVNTFDDKRIPLEDKIKPNCSVLLVADCTVISRFAVFATPIKRECHPVWYALEIYIDDHVVWYTPRNDGKDVIRLENLTELEIKSLTTPFGDEVDLSVYVNAENLLIFELFNSIQIQYFRGEILTIQVPSPIKANLCGICSLPFNAANDYNDCE